MAACDRIRADAIRKTVQGAVVQPPRPLRHQQGLDAGGGPDDFRKAPADRAEMGDNFARSPREDGQRHQEQVERVHLEARDGRRRRERVPRAGHVKEEAESGEAAPVQTAPNSHPDAGCRAPREEAEPPGRPRAAGEACGTRGGQREPIRAAPRCHIRPAGARPIAWERADVHDIAAKDIAGVPLLAALQRCCDFPELAIQGIRQNTE